MWRPMVPRPMNPTFMTWPSVEDLARDAAGRHRGGPAGVERQVGDDLADLVARHAVGQRTLDVAGELVTAVHGDQRGHGDEAAIALGSPGRSQTSPYTTFSVSSISLGATLRTSSRADVAACGVLTDGSFRRLAAPYVSIARASLKEAWHASTVRVDCRYAPALHARRQPGAECARRARRRGQGHELSRGQIARVERQRRVLRARAELHPGAAVAPIHRQEPDPERQLRDRVAARRRRPDAGREPAPRRWRAARPGRAAPAVRPERRPGLDRGGGRGRVATDRAHRAADAAVDHAARRAPGRPGQRRHRPGPDHHVRSARSDDGAGHAQ